MKLTLVLMVGAHVAGAEDPRRRLVERQLRAAPAGWAVEVHFDPPEAEAQARAWLEPMAAGRAVVFNAQCGGDLGERLGHAMLNAFARRAEAVVFTQCECPELDADRLLEAGQALAAADVVVVPAAKGGGFAALGVRSHRLGLFTGCARSAADVLAQALARVDEARLCCVVLGAPGRVGDVPRPGAGGDDFGLE